MNSSSLFQLGAAHQCEKPNHEKSLE